MKILFICNRVDDTLEDRVKRLRNHKAEVSILYLNEYKLDENGKLVEFDIVTKSKLLEHNSKLRKIDKYLKRKKLFSYLDYYDIIDIYKCESSVSIFADKISSLCYDYFITPSNEEEDLPFVKKSALKKLFKNARFLIFESLNDLESCQYTTEENAKFIGIPTPSLDILDSIKKEDIISASKAMGLNLTHDNVYCDLSGDIEDQLNLIDDITMIKINILKNTTFIFELKEHDLNERNAIKELLQKKNFDYLLIEHLLNKKQRAVIFALTNKTIVQNYSRENPTLAYSMYLQNLIYLYGDANLDKIFYQDRFYFKKFDQFAKDFQVELSTIEKDLIKQNHQRAVTLFDPQKSVEKYIEAIKSI
ncbi:MAG: hypothetical protein DSZ06_01625 [Sulfurospirillum sp.]|nr:MAG: hypothetical protein DSZ06_01625 [Sulfurospirillum sp.]